MPDRDFVLTWQPAREGDRPALRVFAHAGRGDPHVYLLGMVSPPARPPLRAMPREVILLVDRSGSMHGPKWEAAAWTARRFLSSLTEDDAFALCLFDDEQIWYPDRPEPATRHRLEQARQLLRTTKPRGGTELGQALARALRLPRARGARTRHVLMITDGQVAGEQRILRQAEAAASATNPRRTSVICIDSAPNAHLVHELVERGQGLAAFLTSNPAEEDIATALDELVASWDRPLWSGLALEVEGEALQPAGRPARGGRIPLGDLPCSRGLWVLARCLPKGPGPVRVRLRDARGELLAETTAKPLPLPGLRSLFGARRLLTLEHLHDGGYTAAALRRRLAELGYDPAESADLGRLLARESLRFGVPGAETALVAVRRERGRAVEGTCVIGNALAAGWSDAFLHGAPSPFGSRVLDAMPDHLGMSHAVGPTVVARAGVAEPATHTGPAATGEQRLFHGTPHWEGGRAVLCDGPLATDGRPVLLSRLRVRLAGAPAVPDGLHLLLYVGDAVLPRARVRLADLLNDGGERPLTVRVEPGEALRVELVGGEGAGDGGWTWRGLTLTLEVGWEPVRDVPPWCGR